MRRGSASIVANPVLVGAVTALVVVVAVFLAYNANKGLPFVPTYTVKIETKNASPNARRFFCWALRVSSSKMFWKRSSSTGMLAFDDGTVSPSE